MSTFTVVSASKKKDVEGRHGPMQVIALGLQKPGEDATTNAEWFTKATTQVPSPGATLEGDLELTEYGFKFKKAQAGGFNSGPRPEDPARAKRILRQHSQSASVELLKLAHAKGIAIPAESVSELLAVVKQLCDKLDADAEEAAA